jgi:hypothetical protein
MIRRTGKNPWKLEYSLYYRGTKYVRIKFYVKSEELLTSCGVATLNTKDPLVSLLVKEGSNSCYKRKMFSS